MTEIWDTLSVYPVLLGDPMVDLMLASALVGVFVPWLIARVWNERNGLIVGLIATAVCIGSIPLIPNYYLECVQADPQGYGCGYSALYHGLAIVSALVLGVVASISNAIYYALVYRKRNTEATAA